MSPRPRNILTKLRGRSATELRTRGLQLANTWLERSGLSPFVGEPSDSVLWGRLSSDTRKRIAKYDFGSLLAEFRAHAPESFFAGVANRDAAVTTLRARWPNAERDIVARADRLRAGRFDLLGYHDLDFGTPIDWHRDPIADLSAPRKHWSGVSYLDPSVVGDHKVIWELNRHQYFITLGRAYWLTGDEIYAQTIADHLASWMNANPPKTGVNWASSLEVSFRAMAWVWALHFLRDSRHLTPSLFRRVLAFLDLHARHVAGHLSTYFSPNTHLTGEALGLFVLGTALPQLGAAAEWKRVGRAVLEEYLPKHIRADGTYVEQSLYYHRYTLDIFLQAVVLARRVGSPMRSIESRLQSAIEHAMYLTRPDGTFPLIGDDDGGELLPIDEHATNDFRGAIGVGAAVFDRADFSAIACKPSEELLWLLGPAGVSAFDGLIPESPANASRAFVDGGYYVMRDDWSASSNFLAIDAGPHGFMNGGHAHADALSIDVVAHGRSIVTDPGTFCYSSDLATRNRFRSTAAHNTISIDGRSSSELGDGAFQWGRVASTQVTRWISTPSFDLFEGSHDGFMRLASPARHERTVLYLKGRYWVIRDRIVSEGDHDVAVYFHCAAGTDAISEADGSIRLGDRAAGDDLRVLLATFASNGQFQFAADSFSPRYGKRVDTTTCVFRMRSVGTQDIVSFIVPAGVSYPKVASDAGGRRFVVTTDGAEDSLYIHGGGVDVDTDADLTWIRRDAMSNTITSFLVIDGSRLAVGETELMNLGHRVEYAHSDSIGMSHGSRVRG